MAKKSYERPSLVKSATTLQVVTAAKGPSGTAF